MKKTKLFKNETEAYLYQWCENALIIIQNSEDLGADKTNALAILLTRLLEKAFNLVPTRFTAELRTYVAEACSTITESNRDGIQISWESQADTIPNDGDRLKQEIIATTKRLLQTDDTEYCLEILNKPIAKSYSPTCTNLIIDILAELIEISKENSDIPDRLKRLWSYQINITSLEFIQDYLQTYKQNDDGLLTIDTTIEVVRNTTTPFTFDNLAVSLEACENCQPFLQDELKAHKIPIRTLIGASQQWLLLDFSSSKNNCNVFISLFLHLFNKSITVSDLKQIIRTNKATKIKSQTNWDVIQSLIAKFSLT